MEEEGSGGKEKKNTQQKMQYNTNDDDRLDAEKDNSIVATGCARALSMGMKGMIVIATSQQAKQVEEYTGCWCQHNHETTSSSPLCHGMKSLCVFSMAGEQKQLWIDQVARRFQPVVCSYGSDNDPFSGQDCDLAIQNECIEVDSLRMCMKIARSKTTPPGGEEYRLTVRPFELTEVEGKYCTAKFDPLRKFHVSLYAETITGIFGGGEEPPITAGVISVSMDIEHSVCMGLYGTLRHEMIEFANHQQISRTCVGDENAALAVFINAAVDCRIVLFNLLMLDPSNIRKPIPFDVCKKMATKLYFTLNTDSQVRERLEPIIAEGAPLGRLDIIGIGRMKQQQ